MRGPRLRLAVRLLAAALGAGLALISWELWLRHHDARAWAPDEARAEGASSEAMGNAPRQLSDRMMDVGAVVLCAEPFAVPEAVVEWQLLADGRLVQRRAAPPPSVPGRSAVSAAAVALPVDRLSALRPEARATLLDLLSSLLRDRPVEASRLLLQDVEGEVADRLALLSWLR